MEKGISIKRIIIDLLLIKDQVMKEFQNNEKYINLLRFLTAKDYLNDDSIPIPTFKEIESQTGIKTYHIRKQLLEIYNSLFNYEDRFKFDFPKCEITFVIKSYGKYASIVCNNLSHIPRIGENINLSFVHAKLGTDIFYVDDIRHYFETDCHSIHIYLKSGIFNQYWHNRLHEAKEKRELPWKDFYDLDDYQLKRELMPKYHTY